MARIPEKIISGGQTGADRAALDTARRLGYATGGWVPGGRLAEDGEIPDEYENLTETEDEAPETRTRLNVESSDATLIVSRGRLTGGSRYTLDVAEKTGKPSLHVDLSLQPLPKAAERARSWIEEVEPRVLNVAGPRASEDPKIYERTRELLEIVLEPLLDD